MTRIDRIYALGFAFLAVALVGFLGGHRWGHACPVGHQTNKAVASLPTPSVYYNCPGHHFTQEPSGDTVVALSPDEDTRNLEEFCGMLFKSESRKPVRKRAKIGGLKFKDLPIGGTNLKVEEFIGPPPLPYGSSDINGDGPIKFGGDPEFEFAATAPITLIHENTRTWLCTPTVCLEIPMKVIR